MLDIETPAPTLDKSLQSEDVTRRTMLRGTIAAGISLGLYPRALNDPAIAKIIHPDSLMEIAAERGIIFGSAVSSRWIGDRNFTRLVTRDCAIIAAENSLKWQYLEPEEGKRELVNADAIAGFARDHGLATRGHCFIWNHDDRMPSWLVEMVNGMPRSQRHPLTRRLWRHGAFLGRTFPEVRSWDVVNEAIDPRSGELRNSFLTRQLGERFLDVAFRIMRAKAPQAELVYNDTVSWGASPRHRNALLRLLERLLVRGVPLDTIGIQSHLGNTFGKACDEIGWRLFLEEIAAMGLSVAITELDCSDRNSSATNMAHRDQETAAFTKAYLDITLDFLNVKQVVLWSLADASSYMNRPGYPDYKRRPDGLPLRGHPYDEHWKAKPMRTALAQAFQAAPARP